MKKYIVPKIIIILISFIFILSNIIYAAPDISAISDDVTIPGNPGAEIAEAGSIVYTIITNVGVVVSVIVMAFLGIKYILGSAEEKANYKNSMMPYIIGSILVFGASGVTKMVIAIVD